MEELQAAFSSAWKSYTGKAERDAITKAKDAAKPINERGSGVLIMQQRTDEWIAARCGKVTASRVADVMATTKSGLPLRVKLHDGSTLPAINGQRRTRL